MPLACVLLFLQYFLLLQRGGLRAVRKPLLSFSGFFRHSGCGGAPCRAVQNFTEGRYGLQRSVWGALAAPDTSGWKRREHVANRDHAKQNVRKILDERPAVLYKQRGLGCRSIGRTTDSDSVNHSSSLCSPARNFKGLQRTSVSLSCMRKPPAWREVLKSFQL